MSTTSIVQLVTIDHNKDFAYTQDSSQHIPLHRLCGNCTKVFERIEDAQPAKTINPPIIRLCTFAHLVIYHPTCHLCMFLFTTLERNGKHFDEISREWNIYIQLNYDEEVFNVGFAEIMPEQLPGESFVSAFDLKKYSCSEYGAFEQHIVAKGVPRLAQDNLKSAKSWLETCLHEHKGCHGFHHSTVPYKDRRRRPTRVLEVSETSVRLCCNMMNESFEYFTLSHIWGKIDASHLKLKLDNIDDFQHGIPWQALSLIYKEAVRTTLALGHRYLWIDSLCIIQDSKPDWNHEANLMATVYGNAACNLAFLFPDTTATRCDPREWNPAILKPATPSSPGFYIQHSTSLLRATYQNQERQDWLVQRHWPLFTRAWTFQEYLLCPRTLLLGHKNLMWQCSELFYDELLGPVAEASQNATGKRGRDMRKSRYFPPSLSAGLGDDNCMSRLEKLEFMIDWQALINEYRYRNLTVPSDRIIAFAGVARAFSNLGNLTYLAGTWAELFPLSLAWYVARKAEATVRHAGPTVLRGGTVSYPIAVHEHVIHPAPSWSQFSVAIYTHHQTYFALNNDEVFVRRKSLETDPRDRWDDIHWAELLSFTFAGHASGDLADTAYSNFTGLKVTLGLPVFPTKRSLPSHLARAFDRIRAANDTDANAVWKPDFEYFPDDPTLSASPPKHGVLALLYEFQICRVAGSFNVQRRLGGLVLIRAEEEGTWKRVGAWRLLIKICGVDVTAGSLGDVADRWRGYELREAWDKEKVVLI